MRKDSAEQVALKPARELARELLDLWSASFAENNPAAMPGLYREDAMLYGSKPELFTGRAGVLRYFSTLAPRKSRAVVFEDVTASFAASDVIAISATAGFVIENLPAIVMRFTQTWVRADGLWQVISHHASPKQGLSQ